MESTTQISKDAHSADAAKYLLFRLGEELFGVDVCTLKEVDTLLDRDLTFIPDSPQSLRGLMNLRGVIVPVLDTRILLGLSTFEDTAESRILVVDMDWRLVGFVVDEVTDLRAIEREEIQSPPSNSEIQRQHGSYLTGIVNSADGVVVLVDLARMLPENPYLDQRSHARQTVDLTIQQRDTGAEEWHDAHMSSISKGGLRMETDQDLSENAWLELSLPLDREHKGQKRVNLQAEVRWGRTGSGLAGGFSFQYGLAFGSLTGEQEALLERAYRLD
ncbi:chemotaxis protein CheW [Thiohalorhabdus sp. Cl-TMA]|uniref:Chemotaxis protein CheW n=1 Tax=Thiohalorhabdus methylotrophus TaxID=3242694 RepID=A0ABV4TY16_9GAMM